MSEQPPISPRQRLQALLAIPDRQRTDEQWDELIELEIVLAPGNREGAPQPGGGGGLGGGGGRRNPNAPSGGHSKPGGGGGGGGAPHGKKSGKKFHKRPPKGNTP